MSFLFGQGKRQMVEKLREDISGAKPTKDSEYQALMEQVVASKPLLEELQKNAETFLASIQKMSEASVMLSTNFADLAAKFNELDTPYGKTSVEIANGYRALPTGQIAAKKDSYFVNPLSGKKEEVEKPLVTRAVSHLESWIEYIRKVKVRIDEVEAARLEYDHYKNKLGGLSKEHGKLTGQEGKAELATKKEAQIKGNEVKLSGARDKWADSCGRLKGEFQVFLAHFDQILLFPLITLFGFQLDYFNAYGGTNLRGSIEQARVGYQPYTPELLSAQAAMVHLSVTDDSEGPASIGKGTTL